MMTADTPIRSKVRTVYTKCSVSPPVSPSRIMGLVVTSMISLMVFIREEKSTSSMSGLPLVVESHREDTHIPSNCRTSPFSITAVFSAMRPVSPLWASMQVMSPLRSISHFSRPRRRSGMDAWARAAASSRSYSSLWE